MVRAGDAAGMRQAGGKEENQGAAGLAGQWEATFGIAAYSLTLRPGKGAPPEPERPSAPMPAGTRVPNITLARDGP